MKLADLRIAFGEIDLDVAAALGDLRGDADVVVAAAVVVEKGLAMEDAVLPGRDHGARLLLPRHRARLRSRPRPPGAPNLRKQLLHSPLAEMRSTDHRGKIAAKIMRIAHIERDHVQHVVAQPAGLVQLDRRDPQAFLPDLGGIGL